MLGPSKLSRGRPSRANVGVFFLTASVTVQFLKNVQRRASEFKPAFNIVASPSNSAAKPQGHRHFARRSHPAQVSRRYPQKARHVLRVPKKGSFRGVGHVRSPFASTGQVHRSRGGQPAAIQAVISAERQRVTPPIFTGSGTRPRACQLQMVQGAIPRSRAKCFALIRTEFSEGCIVAAFI